mmetsp:Transcript_23983/g.41319  ORF Transcript_23983/g.41319 Transcript_23983/m.41319 type:complete len:88 (-) Transcript_23983:1587-1850(-)
MVTCSQFTTLLVRNAKEVLDGNGGAVHACLECRHCWHPVLMLSPSRSSVISSGGSPPPPVVPCDSCGLHSGVGIAQDFELWSQFPEH